MAEKDLKFKKVKLLDTELGIGSYGSVCWAQCDQLVCAAKLIHNVLVNRTERRNLEKFEQECKILSGMRHPNIVQYLGTDRDPQSGLPVLLMELMDENLTHFLKKSQERLPYHLEVNLCHDIALALAYLHSNGIIHRDLSSNNVLLIAGSRAKVTDFGMSKLLDAAPQTTPLTQCPGTSVYMSPEAMRIPPVYTEYLDCFSHGVLGIQIMTREFPDPGANEQLVENPQSPVGMIKIPIPDTERRKSHIDRIDPHHPLLPIAIQCLSYNERDRPTSQELCKKLASLKDAHQYKQSMQRGQGRVGREETAVQERDISQLRKDNQKLNLELMKQLTEKEGALQVTNQDIELLSRDNRDLRRDLEQASEHLEQELRQAEEEKKRLCEQARGIREELVKQSNKDKMMLRAAQQANEQLHHSLEQAVQEVNRLNREKQQLVEENKRMIQEKDELQETLEKEKQQLSQQLAAAQHANQQLQSKLSWCNQNSQHLHQQLHQAQQHLRQQLHQAQQRNHQLHMNMEQLAQKQKRLEQDLRGKEQVIKGKERLLRDNEHDVARFQQVLTERTQENQSLNQDTRGKEQLLEEKEKQLRDNERDRMALSQENQKLTQYKEQLLEEKEKQQEINKEVTVTLTQKNQRLTQTIQDRDEQIAAGERQLQERDEQIKAWGRKLQDSEGFIAEFQQNLTEREMEINLLREDIALQQPVQQSEACNSGDIRLTCVKLPNAPCKMYGENATSHGTMAYFSESGQVHEYNSETRGWSELPKCPQEGSTLVVVNDLLTAVGGEESGKRTNVLLSWKYRGTQRKWSKHFPPMPTKRTNTAVVCSGRSLVVAGGVGEKLDRGSLTTVEVMDTETLRWSTASNLPYEVEKASMAVSGDNLYLLGGYDQSGRATEFVLTCSLSALLESCQPFVSSTKRHSVTALKQRSHSVKDASKQRPQSVKERRSQSVDEFDGRAMADAQMVWTRVANVSPLSTCTTLCGQLLAVGGCPSDKSYTDRILKYDPAMNTWTPVSRMTTPRAQSLVAVLPGDRLMVVGGWTSSGWTDVVEIASLM